MFRQLARFRRKLVTISALTALADNRQFTLIAQNYAVRVSEFVRTISTGGGVRSVTVANAVIASANAIDRKTTFREDAAKSSRDAVLSTSLFRRTILQLFGQFFLWHDRVIGEVIRPARTG